MMFNPPSVSTLLLSRKENLTMFNFFNQDLRLLTRQPLAPSSVVRALNHSLSSGGGTLPQKWPGGLSVSTSYSQPSSPMKKESSPFRYSGINQQMTATPPVS